MGVTDMGLYAKYHDEIMEQQRKLREKGFMVDDTIVYLNPTDRRRMWEDHPEYVTLTDDMEVNGAPVLESPDLPEGIFAVTHRKFDRYPEALEIARFSLHDRSVHVVVGMGRWPESGQEVVKAFQSEASADDFIQNGNPDDEASETGGWEMYVTREVPLDG